MTRSSDREWEKFGSTAPYFGVVTADRFRGDLDDAARAEFFRTGEEHVASLWLTISERIDSSFDPSSVLDFGCGVGRVVVPFARRAEHVVGVDVSPSMLREARSNCARAGLDAELVLSDDELSNVTGEFDLVHSVIVFQHIPTDRGFPILELLVGRHLSPGGVGVIQLTYGRRGLTSLVRVVEWLRPRLPGLHGLINLARGRPFDEPHMQMNRYDLGRVFEVLRSAGCTGVYSDFTDHEGRLGVTLYFRKPVKAPAVSTSATSS